MDKHWVISKAPFFRNMTVHADDEIPVGRVASSTTRAMNEAARCEASPGLCRYVEYRYTAMHP